MNGCFNCGSPDHWKEQCPVAMRADSYEEHLGRITGFVDQWAEGVITLEQKRINIGSENMQWYGPNCPSRLRWPPF